MWWATPHHKLCAGAEQTSRGCARLCLLCLCGPLCCPPAHRSTDLRSEIGVTFPVSQPTNQYFVHGPACPANCNVATRTSFFLAHPTTTMENQSGQAKAPTFELVEDILSSLRTSRSSRFSRPSSSRRSRRSRTLASSSSASSTDSNSNSSSTRPRKSAAPTAATAAGATTTTATTRKTRKTTRPRTSPTARRVRSPLRSRNGLNLPKEKTSLQALKELRIAFFAEVAKKGSPSKSTPAERERFASYLSNKYLAQRLDALPPSNAVRAIRKEIASSIDIIATQAARSRRMAAEEVEAAESKTARRVNMEQEEWQRGHACEYERQHEHGHERHHEHEHERGQEENRPERRRQTARQEWPGKKQETPRDEDAHEERAGDENAGPELWHCNICGKKNAVDVGRCITCGRGRHAQVGFGSCRLRSVKCVDTDAGNSRLGKEAQAETFESKGARSDERMGCQEEQARLWCRRSCC